MGKLSSVLFALSVALFSLFFFRTSIQVIKKGDGDETGQIETQEIALRVLVVYFFSSSYWSHFRQVWRKPSPNLVQPSRCATRPQSLSLTVIDPPVRSWEHWKVLLGSRRWEASFSGVDIFGSGCMRQHNKTKFQLNHRLFRLFVSERVKETYNNNEYELSSVCHSNL